MTKFLPLFMVSLIFSVAEAKSPINIKTKELLKECPLIMAGAEELLKRQELSKSWESLPASVLVAKEAHLIVEGEGFRTESFQNFLRPGSAPLVCGSGKMKLNQRFSILAPTLIDLTSSSSTGSSVWNFQLIIDHAKVRSWNLLSRISTNSLELAKIFKEQGAQEKYFRRGASEYEIVATKEVDGKHVTLRVVFDSVDKID